MVFDLIQSPSVISKKSMTCIWIQSSEHCESYYSDYARGAKCYCTPFHGCFHQHFQVKPSVTITGEDGLHNDKQHGVHEHDYYIEITATNGAFLTSIAYLKVIQQL